MKDNWRKELLQRRMTRKEFLGLIGGSMLMLLGFGQLIKLWQQGKAGQLPSLQESSQGFGSRKFGA